MRSTGRRALIWRYTQRGELHASVSDRARFPVIFELYSTRFGTATPNPDLGPERATNLEVGWKGRATRQRAPRRRRVLQRRPRPDSDRRAAGHHDADAERRRWASSTASKSSVDAHGRAAADASAATTRLISRDHPRCAAAEPAADRRADAQGVPLRGVAPIDRLTITPSLDVAGDRWSDVNPAPAFPYVRTGALHADQSGGAVRHRQRLRRGASGSRTCATTTTSWRGGSRSRDARSTSRRGSACDG